MDVLNSFKEKVLKNDSHSFERLAIDIFRFQSEYNPLYRKYLDNLNVVPTQIGKLDEIPFLPIEFFKNHDVKTGSWSSQKTFLSSGTTSSVRSRHLIEDENFYHKVCLKTFEGIYGNVEDLAIMALLPSYQQQGNSGLISMVDYFISSSKSNFSGFYLDDYSKLVGCLQRAVNEKEQVILFGVSYALLEFVKHLKQQFCNLVILETGGMKGRGKELTKIELHECLSDGFGIEKIHSEYGMTELMSQAYSVSKNGFEAPNSMRVLIRDINDPFKMIDRGKVGGINVIDLANIHSCSFVETQDIGRVNFDGKFEVLGRIDNSDLRGCNLLVN